MKRQMIKDKKTGRMWELKKYERTDGRFERQIVIGRKANGKPEKLPVYGKSAADLERNVAEVRHKLNHGIPIITDSTTIKVYAQTWLDVYKVKLGHKTKDAFSSMFASSNAIIDETVWILYVGIKWVI